MFKGYLNVARIVQAQLEYVSYFYSCFQIFRPQTMRLTWEFCFMTQTILGLLSVACYLRFAIGNLLFMFFFWDLQLLARKLLSFATIVRLAIFSIKHSLPKNSQCTFSVSCVKTTAFSQKIYETNPRIPESQELSPGLVLSLNRIEFGLFWNI